MLRLCDGVAISSDKGCRQKKKAASCIVEGVCRFLFTIGKSTFGLLDLATLSAPVGAVQHSCTRFASAAKATCTSALDLTLCCLSSSTLLH